MKRLVFAPAARDDLLTIGLYIAEDNPGRADSFVAELEATARQIVEWPGSFPSRVYGRRSMGGICCSFAISAMRCGSCGFCMGRETSKRSSTHNLTRRIQARRPIR
jgi:plasmid stabilization system protein ParE